MEIYHFHHVHWTTNGQSIGRPFVQWKQWTKITSFNAIPPMKLLIWKNLRSDDVTIRAKWVLRTDVPERKRRENSLVCRSKGLNVTSLFTVTLFTVTGWDIHITKRENYNLIKRDQIRLNQCNFILSGHRKNFLVRAMLPHFIYLFLRTYK